MCNLSLFLKWSCKHDLSSRLVSVHKHRFHCRFRHKDHLQTIFSFIRESERTLSAAAAMAGDLHKHVLLYCCREERLAKTLAVDKTSLIRCCGDNKRRSRRNEASSGRESAQKEEKQLHSWHDLLLRPTGERERGEKDERESNDRRKDKKQELGLSLLSAGKHRFKPL